jgi:hypothetical protein
MQSKFEEECSAAVGSLRAAIIDLYDSVGADPLSPQDVARRFSLNKTLTWNIARMIQASTGIEAIPHVPGNTSIEKVIRATTSQGASSVAAADVRAAAKAFAKMVDVHVGDRATLELITDGMGIDGEERLERSRKLAFRGNSGIYGVQARTRLACHFAAPNGDAPDRLDLVSIHGYVAFRRLRSAVNWPLFKARRWNVSSASPGLMAWNPISGMKTNLPDPCILQNFTQGRLPEIAANPGPHGVDIMLLPGTIGNFGAFDCFRGEQMRSGVARYRTPDDALGEFGVTITTPCENAVLDLIAHRDLASFFDSQTLVFSKFIDGGQASRSPAEVSILPISKAPTEIPGNPPSVATPLVPKYPELVAEVMANMGWNPLDFRGIRVLVKFPPLGSHIVMRSQLPERIREDA